MANLQTLVVNDEILKLPAGSNAERPGDNAGYLRYNNSNSKVESNNGSNWSNAGFYPISATGGTVTTFTKNGVLWRQHQFNSSGTFTVNDAGSDGIIDYILEMDGSDGDGGLAQFDGTVLRNITRDKVLFSYVSTDPDSANAGRGVEKVDGESDPCSGEGSLEDILDYCHTQGARMPTLEEMINNVTQGSGCGYDNRTNWVATPFDDTRHYRCYGDNNFDRSGGFDVIDNITGRETTRRVADNDSNRTDPNILSDPFILDFLQNNGYTSSFEIVDPPRVQTGQSYDMALGSAGSISGTGPVDNDVGVRGNGRIKVQYPLEPPRD